MRSKNKVALAVELSILYPTSLNLNKFEKDTPTEENQHSRYCMSILMVN